jgi:hypothetical protein
MWCFRAAVAGPNGVETKVVRRRISWWIRERGRCREAPTHFFTRVACVGVPEEMLLSATMFCLLFRCDPKCGQLFDGIIQLFHKTLSLDILVNK